MGVCDNRHSWIQEWRLLLQEWVRPTLEDATPTIDSEVCTFCIEPNFNIFSFHTFADIEDLAEQMNLAMSCDLPEEGYVSSCDAQGFGWDNIVGWQFADLGTSAMLSRGQTTDPRLNMLMIDCLLQAQQFALEGTDLGVMALKQTRLEPTVEVLDTAIVLWLARRDQKRFDPKAQAQAQYPRQVARCRSPAHDLAGIVELNLLG